MNVMKMLESKLFTEVPGMYGVSWKEMLAKVTPRENEVIPLSGKTLVPGAGT